jgi:hypothetical protein
MICRMDVYALSSADGTAMFVEALLKQNMLPSPERFLPNLPGQKDTFFPQERVYFPVLIRLDQEDLFLALQVGQIARDLRAETTQRLFGDPTWMIPESIFLTGRRARIQTLQQPIHHSRDKWGTQFPGYWTWLNGPERLPHRVFAWVTHVCRFEITRAFK